MAKVEQVSSPGSVPHQDEGAPYPGRIPQILDGLAAEDCVLASMRAHNIPITRENYLSLAYGAKLPAWGPELEAELPEALQTWEPWEGSDHEDEDEDEE